MTLNILEALRRFQEHLLEVGLARTVLALPAPRMLALQSPSGHDAEPSGIFVRFVTEPEIEQVSRDLFASGHYSFAVQEAYKAVDKFVAQKAATAGPLAVTGTSLMDLAFSPSNPILHWSDRKSASETDEQKGYQRLYSGAMLGIRNPVTHEFNWVEDAELALELIIFAQHLLRKAKLALVNSGWNVNNSKSTNADQPVISANKLPSVGLKDEGNNASPSSLTVNLSS